MSHRKNKPMPRLSNRQQESMNDFFIAIMTPVILAVEAAGGFDQAIARGFLGDMPLELQEAYRINVPVAKGGSCQEPVALPKWNKLFASMMQDQETRNEFIKMQLGKSVLDEVASPRL